MISTGILYNSYQSHPAANTDGATVYIGDRGEGTVQGSDFGFAESLGWVVNTNCK